MIKASLLLKNIPLITLRRTSPSGRLNPEPGFFICLRVFGERNEGKTLKDSAMLKRLNDISALP
jgi:hypothetical protein